MTSDFVSRELGVEDPPSVFQPIAEQDLPLIQLSCKYTNHSKTCYRISAVVPEPQHELIDQLGPGFSTGGL